MKKLIQITWIACLIFIISCNSGTKKSNSNQMTKPEINLEQAVLGKDSTIYEKKPTPQYLYSEIEKTLAVTAELKHDSSTLVKYYTHQLGNNKNVISCYYSRDRLIRIESRIFNKRDEVISFRMFDFDEKNNCFSNSKKDNNEKSCIYAYIDNYIIEYNSKLTPFVVASAQKKQIIGSVKATLDSIMQHFPEFEYSFNWK